MNKFIAALQWYRNSWLFKYSIVAVSVLVFTILMDELVMPWYVKLGDETELPDVIEMSVAEATTTLEASGFQFVIRDSLYHADYEVGTVIEQNPYPYSTVKKNRRVYLTVSIGEKPIIMPNLFGVSPREAELILEGYNLNLNAKNYVYNDIYHEGTVMGQSYPQGQQIKAGSNINITISLGQLKAELQVPDLIGKSFYEAKQRLRAMKLKIRDISYEERENILPETVIGQDPRAGYIFVPNDSIDLVVSTKKSN